jgi:glutamate dehydrogenase
VRAAVADWKPMLARLDQAISEFRYAPVPLDKADVSRGDRLPRMAARRQFHLPRHARVHYSGGEKSGTLERSDAPGLGILADPDVLVLRRGTRGGDRPRRRSAPSCTAPSR